MNLIKKGFPRRARLPKQEDESSGNVAEEINTHQLSVGWGSQQKKGKERPVVEGGNERHLQTSNLVWLTDYWSKLARCQGLIYLHGGPTKRGSAASPVNHCWGLHSEFRGTRLCRLLIPSAHCLTCAIFTKAGMKARGAFQKFLPYNKLLCLRCFWKFWVQDSNQMFLNHRKTSKQPI